MHSEIVADAFDHHFWVQIMENTMSIQRGKTKSLPPKTIIKESKNHEPVGK